MKKVKSFLLRIYHIPALKYIVVALIAVVLIGFVDENSVWNHMRNKQRISDLEDEIEQYNERFREDQERSVRSIAILKLLKRLLVSAIL